MTEFRILPSTSPCRIHRDRLRIRVKAEAALLPRLAVCALESLEVVELTQRHAGGSSTLSNITELVALQAEADMSFFGTRSRWSRVRVI